MNLYIVLLCKPILLYAYLRYVVRPLARAFVRIAPMGVRRIFLINWRV